MLSSSTRDKPIDLQNESAVFNSTKNFPESPKTAIHKSP